MNWLQILKRPFIRLQRLGHNHGYGVHSPFAFLFLTQVVYEKGRYYHYDILRVQQKALAEENNRKWATYEPKRIKRLLFRLVNWARPETIIDAGVHTAARLYLQAGRNDARYTYILLHPDVLFAPHVNCKRVDFMYIHNYSRPEAVEESFKTCAPLTGERSVFVVYGIHYNKRMTAVWKRMQQHPRVGITFDLYDIGILLFDKKMTKQDYVVYF